MKKLKTDMGEITQARHDEEMLFSKKISYETLYKRFYRLDKAYKESKEESEDWYQKWLKIKQS
jgi:predicted nucleotide-binding protein (sugar kinase/HSP70/actin superfamily)